MKSFRSGSQAYKSPDSHGSWDWFPLALCFGTAISKSFSVKDRETKIHQKNCKAQNSLEKIDILQLEKFYLSCRKRASSLHKNLTAIHPDGQVYPTGLGPSSSGLKRQSYLFNCVQRFSLCVIWHLGGQSPTIPANLFLSTLAAQFDSGHRCTKCEPSIFVLSISKILVSFTKMFFIF